MVVGVCVCVCVCVCVFVCVSVCVCVCVYLGENGIIYQQVYFPTSWTQSHRYTRHGVKVSIDVHFSLFPREVYLDGELWYLFSSLHHFYISSKNRMGRGRFSDIQTLSTKMDFSLLRH